jgi:pimeloyl-ACP methyl ester carboxylesterase
VLIATLFATAATEAAEPISEERYIALGGIDQWITIRTKDRDAPVLLWIHGGPADVQSSLASTYETWTESYTLVQWDQRGAGRTYQKNPGPDESVTLDRISQDGIELVEHLQKHLGVKKIIVAGHSWGSLVGIVMARARPDLIEQLIGAGQVSSWRETVKWQYEYALNHARAAGDAAVVKELEKMGLPPHDDFTKYSVMRNKLSKYFAKADSDWLQRQQSLYSSAPGITSDDLKAFMVAGRFSFPKLLPTIIATDLRATVHSVDVPFCVIQGGEDTFTPLEPAKAFFDHIDAPHKHFEVIEGAGHFAAMTDTQAFLSALKTCRAHGLKPNPS